MKNSGLSTSIKYAAALSAPVVVLSLSALVAHFLPQKGEFLALALSIALLYGLVIAAYIRITENTTRRALDNTDYIDNIFSQIASLSALQAYLDLKHIFPRTRGWAASPDFLLLVAETVISEKPLRVVECSSGASTVVIAECLRRNGTGKCVSLENEQEFADLTRKQLQQNNLSNYATVLHTPLSKQKIENDQYLWYEFGEKLIDDSIDLLVIDGPPGFIQKNSRYPALPSLWKHLSDTATIIVDDGAREDESRIVQLWVERFEDLSGPEYIELDKGAYILRRNKNNVAQTRSL